MLSIEQKIVTRRRALAAGFVKCAPGTLARLAANDLPKKDVLLCARVAGMMAAKKTPDLIPDCHPIPLEKVEVALRAVEGGVSITAEAVALARTGLEMEALTAVSAAALTVYDMLKPVDKALEITGIRLVEKEGGKSDFGHQVPEGFRAAVVVTSDRSFEGKRADKTGPSLVAFLRGLGVTEPAYALLPDDREAIARRIGELCDSGADLILTTGGTGLSPRDVTVEAVAGLLDREIPGVMEAARAYGQDRTPYAMLSRGVAGLKGKTLIVTLPGSSGGVEDSLNALFPYLLHAYKPMKTGKARPTAATAAGEKCD